MIDNVISDWLNRGGMGKVTHNKCDGKITSVNYCDCLLASNWGDVHQAIDTIKSSGVDYDMIQIKPRKVGYAIHIERTVRG